MNPIARRLLGAAAATVARKLLTAVPDNPGTALALRSDTALAPFDRSDFSPTVRPSQTLYAPPAAPVQPVTLPPPAARRRVRKVVTTERIYMEGKW